MHAVISGFNRYVHLHIVLEGHMCGIKWTFFVGRSIWTRGDCDNLQTAPNLCVKHILPSSTDVLVWLHSPVSVPLVCSGSGGGGEDQRRSAPRGAKDVAFPSEHFQPPGVHPGRPTVSVEYQALYHMSGNRSWSHTRCHFITHIHY